MRINVARYFLFLALGSLSLVGCSKSMGYRPSQVDPQTVGPSTVSLPKELLKLNPDLKGSATAVAGEDAVEANGENQPVGEVAVSDGTSDATTDAAVEEAANGSATPEEYDEETAVAVSGKTGKEKAPKRIEQGYLARFENYASVWIQIFPNLSPLKTTSKKYPRAKSFTKVSFSSAENILVMSHKDSKTRWKCPRAFLGSWGKNHQA